MKKVMSEHQKFATSNDFMNEGTNYQRQRENYVICTS